MEERLGSRGIACVSGDESHDGNRCRDLPRQNAYNVVFVFFGKHVAEHEHADINVSIFQPLGSLDRVIGSGWRDALSTRAEFNLTLRRNLVSDSELSQCFPWTLAGNREIGVLVSNALCGQERFLDCGGRNSVRVWPCLRHANGRENVHNRRSTLGDDAP